MDVVEVVVIGAGQAGLSAAHHLKRLGAEPFVVLDANERPGGAWQHRWDSLTMADVHGIAELPGMAVPEHALGDRANVLVPRYFAEYERHFDLPVVRPVRITSVAPVDDDPDGVLRVGTTSGTWLTRSVVNATGTWETPFVPYYPGIETFRGRQLHTVDYRGPDELAGRRVVVVGGGASAVQLLGELAPVADTIWVTRREPVWRTSEFTRDVGRQAVALVEERVAQGLPPRSVVSVTGLMLRPQEERAAELGAYARRPMFARVEPDGVRWPDGSFERADVILWATGFRPTVGHLRPLHLRSELGGIRLVAPFDEHTFTTSTADPRIHFVGYGPSASTIGANRAGRAAARAVRRQLARGREAVA
ncbi:NAD(P)/FAD-dependent oxidoreductase [Terrabacter sp. MAHUQ-38]|uniref:NAD(P)-binding domain-containing protein n=1 Tax=Terrabacter sp. MAHUQ-38 TaxID=2766778 RepID=UPI00165D953A|nr:NAD(P)/FAD-dependent oxidoreductase [Terrabacter sp. MAHUQ-38]